MVSRMRTLLYVYMSTLTTMLLLTSCIDDAIREYTDEVPSVSLPDSVKVELGMSFHKDMTRSTRMSANATQRNGIFRGINDFSLIPFEKRGAVEPNDVPLSHMVNVGQTLTESQLIGNSNAVFFKPVYVPQKTASFLVYGHAPADSDPFTNGALSGFSELENITKASDITFSLHPVFTETGVPAIAQELAGYLTTIASIQYVLPTGYYGDLFYRVQRSLTYKWSNPDSYDHEGLADAFSLLSNDDRVMGSSSRQLSNLLTRLYNRLYVIANDDPTEVSYYASSAAATPLGTIYPYRELATAIRTAINNPDYVLTSGYGDNVTIILKSPRNNYPANFDLPDGAAGVQWNADAQTFQVVMETKASAKVMSANRFCYPPILCYYANSSIKTSDADSEEEHYIATNTWSQILANYQSTSDFVNSKTRAIALTDAINYGVAQLCIRLKLSNSNSNILLDSDNRQIEVGLSSFPFTGIILGPQYDVAYNFNPRQSSDEHAIYDAQVVDVNNGVIYMVPFVNSEYTQTLALPTRKDEVVYLILEFENRSGVDFVGANGIIMNGSKFYMTAKLDPKNATGYNADDNTMNRVFSQDGYTEVTCVVSDLKGAWNVVPDTRDPQLEIGVSMEMKWTHSTTTNVLLD